MIHDAPRVQELVARLREQTATDQPLDFDLFDEAADWLESLLNQLQTMDEIIRSGCNCYTVEERLLCGGSCLDQSPTTQPPSSESGMEE